MERITVQNVAEAMNIMHLKLITEGSYLELSKSICSVLFCSNGVKNVRRVRYLLNTKKVEIEDEISKLPPLEEMLAAENVDNSNGETTQECLVKTQNTEEKTEDCQKSPDNEDRGIVVAAAVGSLQNEESKIEDSVCEDSPDKNIYRAVSLVSKIPATFQIKLELNEMYMKGKGMGNRTLSEDHKNNIYDKFVAVNFACPIRYQHTRKNKYGFAKSTRIHADCPFSTCDAKYIFEVVKEDRRMLVLRVERKGQITHLQTEIKRRYISKKQRLTCNAPYGNLDLDISRNTGLCKQIAAGNLTFSPTSQVRRTIRYEQRNKGLRPKYNPQHTTPFRKNHPRRECEYMSGTLTGYTDRMVKPKQVRKTSNKNNMNSPAESTLNKNTVKIEVIDQEEAFPHQACYEPALEAFDTMETRSLENGDSDDVLTSGWFMMLCSVVENLNSSYPNQKIVSGYVQMTCLQPFQVISFNENRLGIAIDVLKMGAGTTLYVGTALDVVKKLPQNQDVSLSVALFRGKDSHHHPLVLSDMLSEKRDASTYQHWLTLLDDALEKVSSGASIKRTESNYNLELLSALTMAFNKMSLPLYLQICHNALSDDGGGVDESQKKSSSTEDLNEFLKSALHICSFHTIYLFNKFFSQLDISPETIKFYLFAMGCMITSDSYAMTKDIFRDVCTVALNDKKTDEVNKSFRYICEMFFQDRDEIDNLIKRVQNYEGQMEDVRDQPGYSPFTADFVKILEEVNSGILSSEDDEVNTRFCPDFLTYFIQYWSSITPLWTANILRIVVSENLVTNESTRDFFSTIKMQGERRWSYDKFLTTMSAKYKVMSDDYDENLPLVVHNGNEAEITSANS